jgi:rhamnose utilization protein RhaD (predicted bifunctional aldolase and dehydrogenase)
MGFRPFSKLAWLPFVTPSMLLGIEPAIDECVKRQHCQWLAMVSHGACAECLVGRFG